MAQEKIIISFQSKGSEKLITALKNLKKAQDELLGAQKQANNESKKQAKAGGILDTGHRRLAKTNGMLANSFATIRSKMLLMSFAMSMGIKQIIDFTKEAAKVESMARAFNTLSGGAESGSVAMEKLQKATNGTMDQFNLFQQANNAMVLGVAKNSDEMAEMFDIAQRLGRALGRDTASSVESLITGIGRQSRLMLDNIGIIVKAEEAYEDYAKKLGISADKLTDVDKKQAFLEATMASARAKVATLGDETLSTQDSYDKLESSTSNATIALGGFVSTLFNLPSLAEKSASALDKMAQRMNNVAFSQGLLNEETIKSISNENTLLFTIKEVENQMHQLHSATAKSNSTFFEMGDATKQQKDEMASLKVELDLLTKRLNDINILMVESHDPFHVAMANWGAMQEIVLENNTTIKNFNTDYSDMVAKLEQPPKMHFEKIESDADKALKMMNQFSSSMGTAILHTQGFKKSMEAMGDAFVKALTAMAAQMAARAALFAFFAPFFGFDMSLKQIGKFAFSGGVAHKGGLITDDGKVQRFATGGAVKGGDNVPILAQGGEFVMQRSAVESIGIENLNRMNQGGGGAVTVNVSGNVLSQDFVEGELAENIKEAVRRGTDFGIS